MKKNFALAVIIQAFIVTSTLASEKDNYQEEVTGILDIVGPMYSFAKKCEASNKVAVLGEKDSDNIVSYTTQQLQPILILGADVSDERNAELENEMINKKQLQCIIPDALSSL